jgi:hypothetical protein
MVVKGLAVVYGLSFLIGLILAYYNITPRSNPNAYPLLILITEVFGVALALHLVHTTRMSYLLALGLLLWLVSGTSVFAEELSAASWLESSAFVAAAVALGRTLAGTSRVGPPLDLSLRGIIQDRNSGLLGYRAGRSLF